MKRTLNTGIAIALAALFVVPACKKEEKKPADKAGEAGKPADGKPATTPAAGGGDKGGAPAATGFAVFPADSQILMSFSIEGFKKSALWAQVAPLVQAKLDAEMGKVKEACGFDPLEKFGSMIIGGSPDDEKNMVIVVTGFSKAEMKTCGEAMAKKEGKAFAMVEEDGLVKLTNEGKDMYMAFLDDTTAMVSPNPDKAWVKDRAAGKAGLDSNAAFMGLLKNVDSSATIWMAMMPKAGGDMDLSKNLPGATGAFGSVKLSDGIAIDAGLRFDTPDNAKNAHSMATMGLQQAKGMMPPPIQPLIDKAKLSATGNDMVVQLTLSGADLQTLAGTLGPMFGQFMK